MNCTECSGSGACDVCDGYGCTPDSYPNAGDGIECQACAGSGLCPDCYGEAIPVIGGITGIGYETNKERV